MSKVLKKVFSVALCVAVVGGTAVALPAVAKDGGIVANAGYATDFYGGYVVGPWCEWTSYGGYYMTDDNSDGVYEAVIDIPSVKSGWLTEWRKEEVLTGEKRLQFKITDGSWDNSWGAIEYGFRTYNSQTNLAIMEDIHPGDHIRFTVFLDTTKIDPGCDPDEELNYVTYWTGYKDLEFLPPVSKYEYSECGDGTIYINRYNGVDTDAVIPAEIDGKPVSYFRTDIFSDCLELKSISVSYGIKKIIGKTSGYPDFRDLSSLKVIIPETVTSIIDFPFSDNEKITIYGTKGSYAEEYAKDNNIKFVAMSLKNNSVVPTTAEVGKPITLNAIAEGGTPDYTYALMYKKSTSSTWLKIGKKYGTQNTGSFKPTKAVKYDIMINVKDGTGKIKSKTFTVDVKTPLKNKTTINTNTVKVGEKIVLKGTASGGTVGYKYAFYYKKSKNSDWLELVEPYTTKSIAFKPKSATSYDLKSVVKDASGRTTEKIFTVNVTK